MVVMVTTYFWSDISALIYPFVHEVVSIVKQVSVVNLLILIQSYPLLAF